MGKISFGFFCHEFAGIIEYIDSESMEFSKGNKLTVNSSISCNSCDTRKNGNQYMCENLKLIRIDYDGGFAEYCLVPVGNIVKIPDNIPLNIAALTEPMAIGVHWVKVSGFQIGDNVLIFGVGPIGLILAENCKNAWAEKIIICEINPGRIGFAKSLGYEVESDISFI